MKSDAVTVEPVAPELLPPYDQRLILPVIILKYGAVRSPSPIDYYSGRTCILYAIPLTNIFLPTL